MLYKHTQEKKNYPCLDVVVIGFFFYLKEKNNLENVT